MTLEESDPRNRDYDLGDDRADGSDHLGGVIHAPERIVAAALGLGGRIDVLVNNAGFMTFADPLNVNDKTWDEIFKVNVRAPKRITRAVLAEMAKACRGSIINIGSSWSTRASVFNQDGGGVDEDRRGGSPFYYNDTCGFPDLFGVNSKSDGKRRMRTDGKN